MMPASSAPSPFPRAPPHSLRCPQSKTECGDLGSPKTTDDIVLDRPEDTRGRRRHKTESVRTPGGTERTVGPESGAQRQRCVCGVKSRAAWGVCEHILWVGGCEALTLALSSDAGPRSWRRAKWGPCSLCLLGSLSAGWSSWFRSVRPQRPLPPSAPWPGPRPAAPPRDLGVLDPGCASVSKSSTHMVSRFLLPSVLSEFAALVTSMAGDTRVRIFEQQL